MPNWYLNSMAGLSRFLRYAALRLFWTLRGPSRHNVIKTYRGGLKALRALRRTPSTALLRVCTCPPHCEGRWCQEGKRVATASERPRGKPDGHNGTQGLSRSLSPGRFGYSTFAYPVRYSHKRGARTSLFRPYPVLLTYFRNLAAFTKSKARCSDAEGWGSGFPEFATFFPRIAPVDGFV